MRTWTPRMLALLRREWPTTPDPVALAARLGVTYYAARSQARKLGVRRREAWSEEQVEAVRARYGQVPTEDLAQALGRTVKAVHQQAAALGLCRPTPRVDDAERERIRSLHAEGYCDAEIARILGRERHRIAQHRARLGLRANDKESPQHRARVRQKTREQVERAGVASLGQVRAKAFRDFAVANGWPDWVSPRGVQVLNVLADAGVPLTRPQIAERMGVRTSYGRDCRLLRLGRRVSMQQLVDAGLVTRLPGRLATGASKGRSRHLYTLGPEALRILVARAREG